MRKLLALSQFGNDFQALKIERQGENLLPVGSIIELDDAALPELCQWADEISYCGDFPGTLYLWDELPRVGRKYRNALVQKTVNSKVGTGVKVESVFYGGDLLEAVDRDRLPIVAILHRELEPVWLKLLPYKEKIKRILPLHLGLAALSSLLIKAERSYLVAWVGPRTTEIIVASPEGLVKVARSVPIGLAQGGDLDGLATERFLVDLGREINMTQTFFKQEFRQPAPSELLLLADSAVRDGLERFPLNVVGLTVKYPELSPVTTIDSEQLGPVAHLLGIFYAIDDFNFLPPELAAGRRIRRNYKLAYAVLAAALIGTGGWLFRLELERSRQLVEYRQNLATYNDTRERVLALQRDVKYLRPLKGWESYYREVYLQRPRWNTLISELAVKVSREIVIDNFLVLPGKNRAQKSWRGSLDGKVRASDWQSGLEKLRVFGGELEASAPFMVKKLDYVPKQLSAPGARTFTFKMELEIKTVAESGSL